MRGRAEFGDFQTPAELARQVVACVQRRFPLGPPTRILEPTVGRGTLLCAAAEAFPEAALFGLEIDAGHLGACREALGARAARASTALVQGDVFAFDFAQLAREAEGPLLLLGNPPWVTSAAMPRLGGSNLPAKQPVRGQRGLDARTGAANFDVAEWILARLIDAFAARRHVGAFLVKTQVARRLVERIAHEGWPLTRLAIHGIDAARSFGASVDACLFVFENEGSARAPLSPGARDLDVAVYDALGDSVPARRIGVREGALVADLAAYERVRPHLGIAEVPFRSGIKHDAAPVLELQLREGVLTNGLGEAVDVEPEVLFPLLKGGDLGTTVRPERSLLLPQGRFGEDTAGLAHRAPRAFAYLERHGARLDARRSSIYRKAPRFAVFGLGPYSFAPFKVAIHGLGKEPRFVLVTPRDGRPTMLDDTTYFVPMQDEPSAREALSLLEGRRARDVLRAFVFADQKRPVTKQLLMRLCLAKLRE